MLAFMALAIFLSAQVAQATITTSGNVTPTSDPSDWTSSTTVYIGNGDTGGLAVATGGDSTLTTGAVYLGQGSGGIGMATVDGSASSWTATEFFAGSQNGTGSRASVEATNFVRIGYYNGGGGSVTVDGASSSLTTAVLNLGNLSTATLNITNGGLLKNTSTAYVGSGTGLGTVNIDNSTWTNTSVLNVGYNGTGIVNITNHGSVSNTKCYLGYSSGNVGTVILDGSGSTWTNSGTLYVGRAGSGTLSVTNGGAVSSAGGYIGNSAGGSGRVTVDGTNSTWTDSGVLYVGNNGTGRLSISNGGSVTASSVSINAPALAYSASTLTTDVGSRLIVGSGSGTITNNGTIRLVAGAGAASDTYTPMQYASMSGTGTMQALGGVWNDTDHTVTVSSAAAAAGVGGATAAFNLATAQRALITDSVTGYSVGAAFRAGTADVTFTATSLSPTALASLQSLLASGNTVLSAWNFDTTGTTVSDTNPVYLSLYAGSDQSLSTLNIWHYDGTTWSAFTASDLAYDGTYASFTVTGFSGYAVSGSAPVPIPAAVWLLGSGLAGLVGMRRKLFK
jgi:T5SS/PEP-CTERM-associated repeat protein